MRVDGRSGDVIDIQGRARFAEADAVDCDMDGVGSIAGGMTKEGNEEAGRDGTGNR